MKYAEKNEYMNFYGINKDTVSLLIYRGERDAILGRSLIWKGLDESGNTVIFMDRIYTVSDSDVNLFKEYADKKGWIYKDVNNSMESFTFKGEEKTITSKIKNGRYEYYPYLDTLSYYNFEDGLLSNDSGEFEEGSYIELNETDGVYNCYECEGRGDNECDMCYGSGVNTCEECWDDGENPCEECDGHGTYPCDECDGEGEQCVEDGECEECDKCSGEGDIECSQCSGSGSIECEECRGSNEIECEGCDGGGEQRCSEEACGRHSRYKLRIK
jgi:hypothetical protein